MSTRHNQVTIVVVVVVVVVAAAAVAVAATAAAAVVVVVKAEFDVIVKAVVEYLRGNIVTEYFLTNSAS
jgi:hypothetical protein